jgi:hypothetical protein
VTSAEELAKKAHRAIEELALAGALDRREGRVAGFRRLAADARAIGLFDLGDKLEAVARALAQQESRGDTPNPELADALLASYDRIEALGAELARVSLLRAFGAEDEGAL